MTIFEHNAAETLASVRVTLVINAAKMRVSIDIEMVNNVAKV